MYSKGNKIELVTARKKHYFKSLSAELPASLSAQPKSAHERS
ncbi:hypothetical protein PLUTE_a1569 [Pseudoalteromonas luteoviolacea DSM 6061]|nr:hypothetical protein [Pseudoalteromonas luteoviolacea DSM 6061]